MSQPVMEIKYSDYTRLVEVLEFVKNHLLNVDAVTADRWRIIIEDVEAHQKIKEQNIELAATLDKVIERLDAIIVRLDAKITKDQALQSKEDQILNTILREIGT